MRNRLYRLSVATWTVVAVAGVLASGGCRTKLAFFETCVFNGDCASGLCHSGVCTSSCTSASDCPEGSCSDKVCVPVKSMDCKAFDTCSTAADSQVADASDAADSAQPSGDAGLDSGVADAPAPLEDAAVPDTVAPADVVQDVAVDVPDTAPVSDAAFDDNGCGAGTPITGPVDPPACADDFYTPKLAGMPGGGCSKDDDCPVYKKCFNAFGVLRCAFKSCKTCAGTMCPSGLGTDANGYCAMTLGCEAWQSNPSPGAGEPLAVCTADSDCDSGVCIPFNGTQVCAGPCTTGGTACCPVGLKCATSTTKLCMPL